jgi:hypothetical protein
LEFDHIHQHHNYMNMVSSFEKIILLAARQEEDID